MLILIYKRELMMSIYLNSFALIIFISNTSFKRRIEELTSTKIERQLIFQSDSILRCTVPKFTKNSDKNSTC